MTPSRYLIVNRVDNRVGIISEEIQPFLDKRMRPTIAQITECRAHQVYTEPDSAPGSTDMYRVSLCNSLRVPAEGHPL